MSAESTGARGRPRRVLHVSEVHWGGVVTLLDSFTRSQLDDGVEVHLLAPVDFPDVKVTARHDWSVTRSSKRSAATALWELARVVRRVRPDVVHLHSFVAGLLGRLPGVLPASVAVVYQPHAYSFDLFEGPRRRAVVVVERRAGRRTDLVVANCADEVSRGERHGVAAPGRAIGVAVDPEHLRPPSEQERAAAKRSLGYAERRLVLVMGRLTFQKATDLLVPAWEAAPVPDADLVLVGPGSTDALAPLAPTTWGRSVHAPGGTTDVRTWMWAADVLAVPSRYETVSLVAVEAMAVGLPVVATCFDGATEAIGDAGGVVELGDMGALLEEVARRLDDPERHEREGRAGRERVLARFTPERVHDALMDSYAAAIGRRRHRR